MCESDIADLLAVITDLDALIAADEAARLARRKRGMWEVRDWGDGLPPHSRHWRDPLYQEARRRAREAATDDES